MLRFYGVTTFDSNSMYFGTSNTNNRLVYTGTSTKVFHVAMTASYTCGNAKVVGLAYRKEWDNHRDGEEYNKRSCFVRF